MKHLKVPKHIISGLIMAIFTTTLPAQHRTLTLLFAGDIMGHDSQIESALAMGNGTYDYSSNFRYVQSHIGSADIAIGNLEVTLAGPPYKGYPAFSSPDALATALREAGFDILVNANNHALDRHGQGLERTLDVLDSLGMVQTGVFRSGSDRSVRYPLVVEKNGIRLALLNYTYGTNGIRVQPPAIVNYIDTATIRADLRKAALAGPDFTIALMHWGAEYDREGNIEQEKLAGFLFASGVDAIIGSHPHVVQPVLLTEENRLLVYSLGNMISNQRKRYTDGGILVGMTLEKHDTVTQIATYDYLPVWVHKAQKKNGVEFRLLPAATPPERYHELEVTEEDAFQMKTFLEDTRTHLKGIPERSVFSSQSAVGSWQTSRQLAVGSSQSAVGRPVGSRQSAVKTENCRLKTVD